MNVQYEQQGNYLIHCIRTKEQEEIHLGVLANRHRQYLKQSHKVRYYNLLTRESYMIILTVSSVKQKIYLNRQ